MSCGAGTDGSRPARRCNDGAFAAGIADEGAVAARVGGVEVVDGEFEYGDEDALHAVHNSSFLLISSLSPTVGRSFCPSHVWLLSHVITLRLDRFRCIDNSEICHTKLTLQLLS